MNYYERHIGDYLKDTAHLSLLEHGVYTRLLDVYYTREGGIPSGDAARLIGARSKDERAALAAVLGEFFELRDGLHCQDRAGREIERFHGKQAKAKASADARWSAQRTESERNANASGKHDPSADAPAMRTHSEGNAPTRTGARPSPVPSNQTPEEKERGAHRADVGEHQPTQAGLVCRAMRKAGIQAVNPGDPRLLTLLEQGATLAEFEGLATEAAAKGKGFAWVLVAIQGRRASAALIQLAPPTAVTTASREAEKTQAYLRAQQMTPEQKTAADAARKRVMAEHGGSA